MDNKKLAYVAVALVIILIGVYYVVSSKAAGSALQKFRGVAVSPQVMAGLQQAAANNSLANGVGLGIVDRFPTKVNGTSLVINGKPGVIYLGGDYCPYCAITRWGLIVALMRFGNFTNLSYMTSSSTDVFPDTPTFTFYGSNYTSQYITFEGVEFANATGGALQAPNGLQTAVMSRYGGDGSIPFIDFGNSTILSGAEEPPSILNNQNWQQIVAALQNRNTTAAQGVIGSANIFTAQICSLTNNMPASVCSQP